MRGENHPPWPVTDKHNAPSHFGGESFQDGQARLIALRYSVKQALLDRDRSRSWGQFVVNIRALVSLRAAIGYEEAPKEP